MCKLVKMFNPNKGYKLAIVFIIPNSPFCGIIFKLFLLENEAMHTPTFYKKMNLFNVAFYVA